jgi:hypothetical protein
MIEINSNLREAIGMYIGEESVVRDFGGEI